MQLLRNMDAAAAKGLRRNLILVTSSLPAEGKTPRRPDEIGGQVGSGDSALQMIRNTGEVPYW